MTTTSPLDLSFRNSRSDHQTGFTLETPPKCYEELIDIIGRENIVLRQEEIKKEIRTAIGVTREVPGIVRPASVEEVQCIVHWANRHHIPLYPISRGQNIGYGSKAPVESGHLIVDLGRMNRIRKLDTQGGYVEIEPGVTQQDLSKFLEQENAPFWCDVTGAPGESSPLANILEGGFGHSPKGNRRKYFSNIEAVLGDGSLIQTGGFLGVGPDLAHLFVQSNFGIITSMRVELLPIPEYFSSFYLCFEDCDLEVVTEKIRKLRMQGTMPSAVHIANPERLFLTMHGMPPHKIGRELSKAQALEQQRSPLIPHGYWSAFGGLYGSRQEVQTKVQVIRQTFRQLARMKFVSDRKMAGAQRLTGLSSLFRTSDRGKERCRLLAAQTRLHGMLKGKPLPSAGNADAGRKELANRAGLLWVCPAIEAEPKRARTLLQEVRDEFAAHGFSLPITLSFVEPYKLVSVISIHFDKASETETECAHALQEAVVKRLTEKGIYQYRLGIHEMCRAKFDSSSKSPMLHRLKQTFDPNGIIAPGRYGIGGRRGEEQVFLGE